MNENSDSDKKRELRQQEREDLKSKILELERRLQQRDQEVETLKKRLFQAEKKNPPNE